MCLQHHKEADSGAFTLDQLRSLKSDPYLRRSGMGPGGTFHWRRQGLIIRAGGITGIGCPVLMRFGSTNAIWITQDKEDHGLLNLDLWGPTGVLLFSMRDNDWLVLGTPGRRMSTIGSLARLAYPVVGYSAVDQVLWDG